MPFLPGHAKIPGSGIKGTIINPTRRKMVRFVERFVEKHSADMESVWKLLTPKNKAIFYSDMIQYVIPRQKAMDVTTDGKALDHNLIVNFSIKPDSVDISK